MFMVKKGCRNNILSTMNCEEKKGNEMTKIIKKFKTYLRFVFTSSAFKCMSPKIRNGNEATKVTYMNPITV